MYQKKYRRKIAAAMILFLTCTVMPVYGGEKPFEHGASEQLVHGEAGSYVYGATGEIADNEALPAAVESQGAREAQAHLTEQLYAASAVLMDGDSGRILYEKNAEEVRPMASTTKIMTLLVTLEHADLDEIVTVSSYAASMPDVQLGIREGEQYVLRDLVYSMMLESHNDSAVAIAEHVGKSAEGFARMMNEKAAELGCDNTHFVTPNGLDSSDEQGEHASTARDMARIMRYAIGNETFLEITRTSYYSFEDCNKTRNFTVNNKNALLSQTSEALTGKTGFTGKAGYCYVCAVVSEGRTFVIALLGCGWPPNKAWKWHDAMALINYGKENYTIQEIGIRQYQPEPVRILGGTGTEAKVSCCVNRVRLLLGKHETFEIRKTAVSLVSAPVFSGETAGAVEYLVEGQVLYRYPIVFSEDVGAADYSYYFRKVLGACGS